MKSIIKSFWNALLEILIYLKNVFKFMLISAMVIAVSLFGAVKADAASLTVTNSYANCRSNPGAGNAYLGRVYRGESYEILGKGKAPNGKLWYQTPRGWVCSSFVRVEGAGTDKKVESNNYVLLGTYYVTGYCKNCNYPRNSLATASGNNATVGKTVAMKGLPFGTRVYIEDIGERVVEDRGVGAGVVDVFCANCVDERKITGYKKVYLMERGQ